MLLMAKSKYFCVDVCPVDMKDLLCGGLGFGARGNVTQQRACHQQAAPGYKESQAPAGTTGPQDHSEGWVMCCRIQKRNDL